MEWQPRNPTIEHGTENLPSGLPPSDLSRIQQSFELLAPQKEQMVRRFYQVLLEKFPDFQKFFSPEILVTHPGRFLEGLDTLILHLEHPHVLREILLDLGKQHRRHGITMHHFPPVIETFLHVLFETGEGRMSDNTCAAWAKFLHLIRAIMLEPGVQDVLAKDYPVNFSSTNDIERVKRILLLDDDPQLLNLYQSYLETQGFFCSQTVDVAWAFTHLHMSRYDLVLTDFQMPVMNGIRFRRHLSRIDNTLWPPFILVTGKVNQEIRQLALASGFVTVLKKPQVLGELGSVVNTVLKTA